MPFFESALALILVYLAFAVVASGAQEWVAQAAGWRGKYLNIGLARLIGDPQLLKGVLAHPLVSGMYREAGGTGKPPSYLDPSSFALAIASVILRESASIAGTTSNQAESPPFVITLDYASLRKALEAIAAQRREVASALLPIVDRGHTLEDALQGVEAWFNSGMDRVSGWYKARAQKALFLIGMLLAFAANVDTLAIIATLAQSPALRASWANAATDVAKTGKLAGVDLGSLKDRPPTEAEWRAIATAAASSGIGERVKLPLGYACLAALVDLPSANEAPLAGAAHVVAAHFHGCTDEFSSMFKQTTIVEKGVKVLGWVLTALAGVLGAPFWFAALTKIVNLRGSGPKPLAAPSA